MVLFVNIYWKGTKIRKMKNFQSHKEKNLFGKNKTHGENMSLFYCSVTNAGDKENYMIDTERLIIYQLMR